MDFGIFAVSSFSFGLGWVFGGIVYRYLTIQEYEVKTKKRRSK